MTKQLKIILILLLITANCLLLSLPVWPSLTASAATPAGQKMQNSLNETANAAGINSGREFYPIAGSIINWALNLLGFLFLILVIYGGALWMTAGGSEEKVTKAKKIIVNAAIGLAIILLAKAITFGVLEISNLAVTPPAVP